MTFQRLTLILIVLSLILFTACERVSIQPTSGCTADNAFSSDPNHPKAAKIQAVMDKYLAKGLPGMSILIHDDAGFWIQSAGYADLENELAMEDCHINKLGSITKMMIGSIVWQLVQEGILKIDDPISKYIPEVAGKIENGQDITLAMLVSHTSGIYDVAGDLNFNLAVINDMSKSWTAAEILKYLEGKPARSMPGELMRYSNSNTLLISMILEAATGRKHADLLKERLFEPLGMDNTVYFDYSADFPLAHLAQGYMDFNNDGGTIQNISQLNPGSGNGYTGVYSTVTDLYRFMHALMEEKSLITAENLALIFASTRFDESNSWKSSIGAIHDEYRDVLPDSIHAYGHTGGDIGYSANLNYFPHNRSIFAAVYNYGTLLPSQLGKELSELRKELFAIMAE